MHCYTRAGGATGFYIHAGNRGKYFTHQYFRIYVSVMSSYGVTPELNVALCGGRGVTIPLPHVVWKYEAGPVRRLAYRLSEKFWHRVHRFSTRSYPTR